MLVSRSLANAQAIVKSITSCAKVYVRSAQSFRRTVTTVQFPRGATPDAFRLARQLIGRVAVTNSPRARADTVSSSRPRLRCRAFGVYPGRIPRETVKVDESSASRLVMPGGLDIVVVINPPDRGPSGPISKIVCKHKGLANVRMIYRRTIVSRERQGRTLRSLGAAESLRAATEAPPTRDAHGVDQGERKRRAIAPSLLGGERATQCPLPIPQELAAPTDAPARTTCVAARLCRAVREPSRARSRSAVRSRAAARLREVIECAKKRNVISHKQREHSRPPRG